MWWLSRVAAELLTSDEGLYCTQLLVSSSSVWQSFSRWQNLVCHMTFGPSDRTPYSERTIELQLCSLCSDLLRVPDHVIKRSDLTPFMCYAIFCLSLPCYDHTYCIHIRVILFLFQTLTKASSCWHHSTLCLTQPHVFMCGLFPMQGGIPPCTGNNAHINTWYAATTLIIMKYS